MIEPSGHGSVVLAADVGGTHARLGLVGLWSQGTQPVSLLSARVYRGSEWPDLGAIMADYLASLPLSQRPRRAVVAIAGYPQDGVIVSQNLPWPVVIPALQQQLQLTELQMVNDFAALASAVRWLPDEAGQVLIAPAQTASPAGPVVVLGPGTGLGCAVLLNDAHGRTVWPTEAGQIALAAGTERELQVLAHCLRQRDPVLTGDILSGPGLLRLYRSLATLDGQAGACTSPAAVSQAALAGEDAVAVEALDMFCGLLGSLSADLAVLFGASGGVCLAGGILPAIAGFLQQSSFQRRFFNKGVMQPMLSRVRVRLIEHGQLGIIGAAAGLLPAGRR